MRPEATGKTMGAWSPEILLALLAGAAGIILLLIITHRSRQKASQQMQDGASTPPFGAARSAEPPSVAEPPAPSIEVAAPPPATHTAPPPAAAASVQSYADIAAAQAGSPRSRIDDAAAPRTRVDYTHALADIRPDASYTAVAIASALGIAQSSDVSAQAAHAQAAAPANERSYAAIAADTSPAPVAAKPDAPFATPIDYSGVSIDAAMANSYAAIAVAEAARQA